MLKFHRCPKCNGINLQVDATIPCAVTQKFVSPGKVDVRISPCHTSPGVVVEPSWSGESTMQCMDCGHLDKAVNFVTQHDDLILYAATAYVAGRTIGRLFMSFRPQNEIDGIKLATLLGYSYTRHISWGPLTSVTVDISDLPIYLE